MAGVDLQTFFPEYLAKQQKILRQQKLAEAIQAQGMKSDDPNQMVSGIVIPQSPLSGLAKMGQALAGAYMNSKLDDQSQALGKDYQHKLFGSAFDEMQPTALNPEQKPLPLPTDPQTQMLQDPANTPLGIRNNNPGNMRPNGDNWQGMTGQQNGYLTFDSPESGVRALAKNLMSYDKQGINTPLAIANKWAPAADKNDPMAYGQSLAKQLGVDPNQPLNLKDPQIAIKLAQAITKQENGQLPYGDDVYSKGVGAAFGQSLDPNAQQSSPQQTTVTPQMMASALNPTANVQSAPQAQTNAMTMPNQAPQPMPTQVGQNQPAGQDNGLLGNLFQKQGVDPKEGMLRLMMGDESVLKTATPDSRYKVVGGQLVDLTGPSGPHIVGGLDGSSSKISPLIGSDIHGDDFLNTLEPVDRASVKLVASGDQKSESILSRMKGAEKKLFLAQVEQYNPDYNARQYVNLAAAENPNGKFGGTVRSLNVATSHLQILGTLADALNNGDIPAFNKIANEFSKQTGAPAVTNFESAKEIVGDEVAKAVVGTTGALGDRDSIKQNIKNASSPAQLKGVINTYLGLMAGQQKGLQTQYEQGTRKKDFNRFLEPANSSQPIQIKSDDEFNNLPSGAHFIDPDGKTRVKP